MENQYNYYTPEYDNMDQEPKKKNPKKVPKAVKVICLGLAFGLAASVTFQAGNYVFGKVLGTAEKSGKTAKQTETVDSAKITTSSGSTVTSDIAQIAKNTMPSVVSITNLSVKQVQSFFGGVQQQESTSVGSGIIISQTDSELLILTNNHVVEGSETLTVSFIDEESVEANIKGTDANKDLAVVAVPLENIKDSTMDKIAVATMGDSDTLQVGEPAIAIGNALGYGQSVTTGIISATGRTMEGIDGTLIQTDAAINPGNSGGALLNANGEVIGINTAKVATNTVEGMGYAIPISDASEVIQELMNRETRTKVPEGEQGYLGIEGTDVSEEITQMYNIPTGVYISEIVKNGGADKAGLTKNSVITGLNGITIDSMSTLKEQLQYYRAGETVEITVQIPSGKEKYEEKTVEVTLGTNS